MWVSRMRCAAWKRSSTSHPRIWSQNILKQDEEVTVFGSWHSTLKVDSLCGFSEFWCYWENDPILTHDFKLRGSTTKSEKFGCWILVNFPTEFLWVVRPKVSWAAKWEISRRSGGSKNNFTRKSKRWKRRISTCIHVDRGFFGVSTMVAWSVLKLPFIHEWLYMCPPYPETAAAQAGPE